MIPWLIYLILTHKFNIPEPTAVHHQQLTASNGSASKPTGVMSLKTYTASKPLIYINQ